MWHEIKNEIETPKTTKICEFIKLHNLKMNLMTEYELDKLRTAEINLQLCKQKITKCHIKVKYINDNYLGPLLMQGLIIIKL